MGCASVEGPGPAASPEGPPRTSARVPDGPAVIVLPAETRPTLDAAGAARRVGDFVRFEDEVAAVVRTRKGHYLNFGRPYPAQVLSVWISDGVHRELSHRGSMLGRRLRVEGVVRDGREGPELHLASAADVEVLPVDEAILARRDLDGVRDQEHFVAAVRQLIARGDVTSLDAMAHDVQEDPGPFGLRQAAFFRPFSIPRARADAFAPREALLERWHAHHPGCEAAVLIAAAFHVDRARVIGPEASELLAARALLDEHPDARSWPRWSLEQLRIAAREQRPTHEILERFAAASARHPDDAPLHRQVADRLGPWAGGEVGDWERFLEEQRQRLGGEEGDMLYALVAWDLTGRYRDQLFTKSEASWSVIASGLRALVDRGIAPRHHRSVLGWLAWQAGDRRRLSDVLHQLLSEDDIDFGVWGNLENVELGRAYARRARSRSEGREARPPRRDTARSGGLDL